MKVESKTAKVMRSLQTDCFNIFQNKTFVRIYLCCICYLLKKFAAISGVDRTMIETKLPESPKNPSRGKRIPWYYQYQLQIFQTQKVLWADTFPRTFLSDVQIMQHFSSEVVADLPQLLSTTYIKICDKKSILKCEKRTSYTTYKSEYTNKNC